MVTTDYESFLIAALCADGYYETSKTIQPYAKNAMDIEPFLKFSSAYVINMAFACELYLKSLLLYWRKEFPKNAKDGHDLKALYDRLEICDKQSIESEYSAEISIEEFLGNECRIFVDYRYPYEKTYSNKTVYYKPFEAFLAALSHACKNRYTQHLREENNHAH